MVEDTKDQRLDRYRELAATCAELSERTGKAESALRQAHADLISAADRAEKAEARVKELEAAGQLLRESYHHELDRVGKLEAQLEKARDAKRSAEGLELTALHDLDEALARGAALQAEVRLLRERLAPFMDVAGRDDHASK